MDINHWDGQPLADALILFTEATRDVLARISDEGENKERLTTGIRRLDLRSRLQEAVGFAIEVVDSIGVKRRIPRPGMMHRILGHGTCRLGPGGGCTWSDGAPPRGASRVFASWEDGDRRIRCLISGVDRVLGAIAHELNRTPRHKKRRAALRQFHRCKFVLWECLLSLEQPDNIPVWRW